MIRNLLLLFFLITGLQLAAQQNYIQLSDSSSISLLTNSATDDEIYTLFGHTAIRVQDQGQGLDIVFNYGIFDFSAPNFMYRFVKGETDYMVTASEFRYYLYTYRERGVGIIQQTLNLTTDEKNRIWDALLVNIQPQNRVYRYNYFYDNCSTRPRSIILDNLVNKITFVPDSTANSQKQSYRDLIHECVSIEPWARFGIDLVIGADADKTITRVQKDFLPVYLMENFDHAKIINSNGSEYNFVKDKTELTSPTKSYTVPIDYPLIITSLILFISIILSTIQYLRGKYLVAKIFDTFLFAIAGLGGCIIFFLMFFSIHPCVSPNWNIVWLNPLQLIAACLFFVKPMTKYIYWYHFINFAALTLFLLAWCLIPQHLEIAFLPCVLTLWLRSGINLQIKRKKQLILNNR